MNSLNPQILKRFEMPWNESTHNTQGRMSEPAPELHLWKLTLIVWNDQEKNSKD